MTRDDWGIALEAYLDEELTTKEAEAFADAVAADPAKGAELQARLAQRARWRRALGAPGDRDNPEVPRLSGRISGRTSGRFPDRISGRMPNARNLHQLWMPVALAACLALAFGVPRLLRNDDGAVGPRSTITRDGQVAAVRYGESPGRTVRLESGSIELPAGLSR